MSEPWWKSAVVYQIYPRSFCDTDADGIGDLEGIRRHLTHVRDLGADAIWISPFFTSPMKDYGYDVSDYCDVDPLFGRLEDFDRLVADAHALGIKVLIDWVPNHTSDLHAWFQESRRSRDNPKADWYWWRDPDPVDPAKPPNNWVAAFTGGPAWTWDETRRQWYLHNFLKEQPDLNWRNPDVVAAMLDTLRFWLDRGVDGFRIDVVHLLGKPEDLPDGPVDEATGAVVPIHDYPDTHTHLKAIRQVLDSYPGDRTTVGEVYLMSTKRVATYYGEDHDELHLSFNFPPLWAPWTARAWRKRIERVVEELHSREAWPTWVLSNHDVVRHRTRYGSAEAARAAAVLLLTLRGTPFLYAGEELGLEDAIVPPERVLDPGGRDGCRAPLPWDGTPTHGWATADPWLPWPPGADDGQNVAAQDGDASSFLGLYRRLLELRRSSDALSLGDFAWLDGDVELPVDVLGYRRGGEWTVLVNYGAEAQPLPAGAIEGEAVLTSDGASFTGTLAPNQAVLLRH
ncbi:MAG TPA: alpha-amylase family glycosyl hydrolase [Acidimicrobiales bacterium]|nr:alpha-amylase family glycosyl hydrolase [Acidimicrobiales bacterium]